MALRTWTKSAKLESLEDDPIGRIKGVCLITFQYLRMMDKVGVEAGLGCVYLNRTSVMNVLTQVEWWLKETLRLDGMNVHGQINGQMVKMF